MIKINKLRELIAKTPLWAYGVLGSALLMKIYIDKQWSYWERQGVRGPKPTIGKFGNGTDIMDIQRGTMTPQQWVEKYGKLSGAYFGLLPTLIVSDVEIVKEVTIKEGFHSTKNFSFEWFVTNRSSVLVGQSYNGETQALFRDFVKFSNFQKLLRSSCKEYKMSPLGRIRVQ